MSTNLLGKLVRIVGTDTVMFVLDVLEEDTDILLLTDDPTNPTALDEVPKHRVTLVEENQ